MKIKLKACRFRTMIKVGKGMQRDALDVRSDKWVESITLDDATGRIEVATQFPGLHEVTMVPEGNVTCMYPLDDAPAAKPTKAA